MRLVNDWVEDKNLAETSARLVNLRMFAVSGFYFRNEYTWVGEMNSLRFMWNTSPFNAFRL